MMNLVSQSIENYAAKHSASESPLFKALVKRTYAETELPQMQVGHLEGAFLRMLVRISRAQRILEIGTFTGYSALAMAEGLPDDGCLYTCDVSPVHTAIAQKYWKQSKHGKKIKLLLGPALETILKIKEKLDLVFIDADKENYARYWDLCLPKLKRGGLLVADNVLWSGHVLAPKESSDKAIVAFNKKVVKDQRVEVVMLTVRDGITLAWKK